MMFKKIMEQTGKPSLYTKGTTNFWDDPHISKYLLEAHLDPKGDGASRVPATIDKTVAWLQQNYLQEKAEVLDLGCGPGLYAERLARLGHKVTGVDFSRRSIEHAQQSSQEQGLDITYIYQNYITINYQEQFDLVLLVYCDFGALTNDDRDQLLKKMYAALKPGGVLVFDVYTEEFAKGIEIKKEWEVTEDDFWAKEPHIVLEESFHYPEEKVSLRQTIVLKESGEFDVHRIYDHYYSESDLLEVLRGAGFEGVSFKYGMVKEANIATSQVVFAGARKPY